MTITPGPELGRVPRTVAIIGGGFTGATVALHLARALPDDPVSVLIVEPRPELGAGLAYSTRDPSHRINVPADRMTADCAIEDGFQRWIDATRPGLSLGTADPEGGLFPQRALVAAYLQSLLQPHLRSGRVRHVQAEAREVLPGERFSILLDDGSRIEADRIVIATTHPPPGIPAALAHLRRDPRLIADPSDAARLAAARSAGKILVVGTGLTSADVIASLDRQGYAGTITALSRRGQRSRGHRFGYAASEADFATVPETTALGLLRRVRKAVRRDLSLGLPWQATLDRARRDAPAIWAALPQTERARLLLKLRPWWDVHRFRVAPQIEAVIDRLIAVGRLEILAARLIRAETSEKGLVVTWHARGGETTTETFDAVILTTGPAHGGIVGSSALLSAMSREGLIRADPLGLGLEVTDHSLAVGADARPTPRLHVAGPLARGHIGELMGIPEVTAHAEGVAARIAAELAPVPRRSATSAQD
ncbi:FAD-dependent oxidoreductase [Paracoccus sp. MBLB3053]|uniref:FAD-dependent oxidoreductase n=1 Tax=Paracoccus aurantius TaxID=3073814 RepID=A0ABU2HT25_9RHOB|nr:FAD-dependent oxidoreductase [Paracoccus sp. MBLB3053]MDS9467715.1 FAD-dependent oxidoreductase [Paracoccus sp. MBLB3053]